VDVLVDGNETGSLNVQAGVLNEEVFWKGYEVLSASTMELTKFTNTRVEGTINCNRDGLLYTSIPSNDHWYAEVDGEPAEVVLVGNCMVGLELTEGQHTITFRYRNTTFRNGLLISIGCLLLFVALIVGDRHMAKFVLSKRVPKEEPKEIPQPPAEEKTE
jgi:uncharacterized membrane protein YfhO